MNLRYIGSVPTTFVALGLEVHPGTEFSVSDEDFPAYASRSDIVVVEDTDPEPTVKPSRTRRSPADEPTAEGQPDSAEESVTEAETPAS